MKNFIKASLIIVALSSLCFGLQAQDFIYRTGKKDGQKDQVSQQSVYKKYLDLKKESKSKKKLTKQKPSVSNNAKQKAFGTASEVNRLDKSKSLRSFISYKKTGNAELDRNAYLAAKKKWIAQNPSLYQQLLKKD